MQSKIFIEENQAYQFDFSKADWATDKLHDIFHENGQIWCDADFIAEYLSASGGANIKLVFVKYKVLSIQEWNEHEQYSLFPITPVHS